MHCKSYQTSISTKEESISSSVFKEVGYCFHLEIAFLCVVAVRDKSNLRFPVQ